MPFATIVTKDYGNFDNASNLNREGVFRLNFELRNKTFDQLFPDETVQHDFSSLDHLLPHPVYGKLHWACVLNPSVSTFDGQIRQLLAEAHALAKNIQRTFDGCRGYAQTPWTLSMIYFGFRREARFLTLTFLLVKRTAATSVGTALSANCLARFANCRPFANLASDC